MIIEETLIFEGDKLYRYIPLRHYGEGVYKKDLVMTKKVFVECYNMWIKGVEDGADT